ncbi:hypothetical protein WMY93_011486 [Mugilogobius chulae]|uniref:G-protein coupled receptors family 1 profile domain-containing protein n=1 Tax=Mugilogobius chulae TaxID=88201 RepID=A0AAW0P2V3_9GOBI
MNKSSPSQNVSMVYRDPYDTAVAKNVIVMALGLTINYINGMLIHTFRKHQIFYTTPRYILFIHLVVNDMIQLTTAITLYVCSYVFYKINTSICFVIINLAIYTTLNSPINLAVMAVECYIAICFPLRHVPLFSAVAEGVVLPLPQSKKGTLGGGRRLRHLMCWRLATAELPQPCLLTLSGEEGLLYEALWKTSICENVFYHNPRYILFIHLVVNDMIQLTVAITLFVCTYVFFIINTSLCCILLAFAVFTTLNTPLNLAVMAVECYIAVCFPLRHPQLCSIKRIYIVIAVIWVFYHNPRYILFIHLVVNDMIQLTVAITLFVCTYVFFTINTSLCCILLAFAVFTTLNTPLNLAVMAVECYIAVCFPLRHPQLCSIKRIYISFV